MKLSITVLQLVAVLKETHYLNLLAMEGIPGSAESMYSQNEIFRKFVANLDLMVRWYNKVRQTVIQVEFPLIQGQLAELDVELRQAESTLHWKNDG